MRPVMLVIQLLIAVAVFAAAPPSLDFGRNGVTVQGMRPGTRVAWFAMLRDRVPSRARVTVRYGLEPVTPNGDLFVRTEGRDPSQSIWIIAAIDDDTVLKSAAPDYPTSADPIKIVAIDKSDRISIRSDSISLMYVRRHGAGAWTFSAMDGSDTDADRDQDGWITITLKSLQPLHGHVLPPDRVAAGDLILAIDTFELRSSTAEVGK